MKQYQEGEEPNATNIDKASIPNVMKLMLKMMQRENGHNHKKFRWAVYPVLSSLNIDEVGGILSKNFGGWKEDKLKKLWARHLFDAYTMLCTKIANNFIRYDESHPLGFSKEKVRMHVNKLGAIDVLNDKRKITNILRDFSMGKKYLEARGNWYLPGAPVPDKVEYGTLINQLNRSINKFAEKLLGWRKDNDKKCEDLKPIMEEMDKELSDILKSVDVNAEKEKRSSTIRQPWNKACNLKKCGQFLYSKFKTGNNILTGQFISGKNSRSGKAKYKGILNDCIGNLMNLKDQQKVNLQFENAY